MGARVTIKDLQKIAINRGGVLLSTKFKNVYDKLKWQCEKKHIWITTARQVRNNKSWCPYCAGQIKATVEDMQKLALKKGGKFISKKYFDTDTKYQWECTNGHQWFAQASSIKRGTWCPHCRVNFGEEICRLAFEQIFKDKFIKSNPKWLKNSKGFTLQLDGYSEKLKLAFEYNGSQHYLKNHFFKSSNTIQNDKEKKEICLREGVKLFIITYQDDLRKIKSIIKSKCKEMNIDIKNLNFKNKIKFNSIYSNNSPLIKLKEIAYKKGGQCLSNKYLGSEFPLEFKCKKGHIWKTNPGYVVSGAWCHKCANYKTVDLNNLKKKATQQGGKLLSTKYIGIRRKYKWQCSKGHIWLAFANNIVNKNQWCPKCKGVAKLSIELIHKLAEKKGGKCLSEKYINAHQKIKWQCSKGHIWLASTNNVKNRNHWCGKCKGNPGKQKYLN